MEKKSSSEEGRYWKNLKIVDWEKQKITGEMMESGG